MYIRDGGSRRHNTVVVVVQMLELFGKKFVTCHWQPKSLYSPRGYWVLQ